MGLAVERHTGSSVILNPTAERGMATAAFLDSWVILNRAAAGQVATRGAMDGSEILGDHAAGLSNAAAITSGGRSPKQATWWRDTKAAHASIKSA